MPSKNGNSDNNVTPELDTQAVLNELVTIRKLLAILLVKLGSDSGELGNALGLEARDIRRWISFTGVRRVSEKEDIKSAVSPKRLVSKKTNAAKKLREPLQETEPNEVQNDAGEVTLGG